MAKKNNPKKKGNSRGNKKNFISNIPSKKEEKKVNDGVIEYEEGITVGELAEKIGQTPANVIKVLFMLGTMVTINSSLDDEQVELICMEYGYEVKKTVVADEINFEELEIVDDENDLVSRPPVVTIMGHVDHGKTTLLDYIRKSRVVDGEFGGITQHIGAYQVKVNDKKVTFLDTPGHEAFTAMRARGAQVTDIVIIVVAADDGVMPQTREAVDHAIAANVPIVVAVNKIDKPGADPERIKAEMSELGLMPEEWGGDVVYCNISAKFGEGVDELLETLTIVAELADLKANPKRYAYGTVVEARLDKGRGPVATLLVENGTLSAGDPIVVGTAFGRVRQMLNDKGMDIKEAAPATPVEITGLNEVPTAGDKFMAFENEKMARHIGEERLKAKQEKDRGANSAMSLDDLFSQMKEGEVVDLNIIVKADVNGTAEAVKGSLEKINVEGAKVHVIRSTVGAISESDILLASASNAIIYGFNVRPDANVRRKAEEEGVEIRLHNIIYKMIEEIEAAMKGMLAPELEEVVTGQAVIRQVIKVSKIGNIAGSYVTDGSIKRDCGIRLIRDGIVVYEGKLASLKRFKDDAKEVSAGYECGITIENYNDIKEGDIIEGFTMEEVARK
ncbi:MAG: translation initiation factor IF-2 [Bacilli bacterium]|nr:translation initiation factor IF-2 [Bacilli bacterium]